MSFKKISLLTALLLLNSCSANSNSAGSQITKIITCEDKATPEEFISLLHAKKGGSVLSGHLGNGEDGEYTTSSPVEIWGYLVNSFSYHVGSNQDGDFTEFRAIIPRTSNVQSLQSIAETASIPKIADNYYYKAVGGSDLLLRQYGDDVIISCAIDVRTTKKSINRFMRELQEHHNDQ